MRDFSSIRRVVVKIGTNCLSRDGAIDVEYIGMMAAQVAALQKDGRQVLLVTSGAIGMGAMELGLRDRVSGIEMRQACAAIGQPILMHRYREEFSRYGIRIAQVLLTVQVMGNRKSYVNLRNAVETLLSLGVVPIFNENDSVSTAEIGSAFGDNDRLSAYIASKIDAPLLLILSDIDALYDRDPKKHPDAHPVHTVEAITDRIRESAGAAGSTFSTGGMKTKIAAAEIAARAGCSIVLAHGREPDVLLRILQGEEIGTVFLPRERLANRTRWILHSPPQGTISVDAGALAAMHNHKSLLPSGVVSVEGVFPAGSVVSVNGCAKIVSAFDSSEIRSLIGRHSREIRTLLGEDRKDVIARPEDIIFLEES